MVIVLIEMKFSKEKLEIIKKKLNFDNCFIKDNIGTSNSRRKWNCYLKSMISYGNNEPNNKLLQHGDKNGKFFHCYANQRKSTNQINSIKDNSGSLITNLSKIGNIFTIFFVNLFTTSHPSNPYDLLECMQARVITKMKNQLLQDFTGLKVKEVVF